MVMPQYLLRIAIASSGLGHVSRGVETWALDTARALAARGVAGTLFSAGRGGDGSGARDLPMPLPPEPTNAPPLESTILEIIELPCLRRFDKKTQRLTRLTPGFAWRWGLKQAYGWEQFSFWWRLWPRLRKGRFDILHVQDPMLAYWCRKFRKLGLVKTKEILAHGTEEPAEWLGQFEYVQHLAPHHLEVAVQALGEGNTQDDLVRTMGEASPGH